ncbi:endonuclease/exonuclease/phosphatase family protein [Halorussus lipolyticus]|uniref:endonuclease/exonuclease/phosphatase family protein n=1 Tax=Halorussus lipolyticus TaxID=3034024 RepID=UPI0023E844D4|nr:endonuclease/exonuclease/phosphatase family protein [Halorussus sp. DT80]
MTALATWNCNMAFRKKRDQILRYDPDLLVIQECENPETKGDWSEFSDWVWVGENANKGLGVFARNGITLELTDDEKTESRYVIPVKVDGARDLLAVWAMNDETNPRKRYIGQVYTALEQYHEFVASGAIVAGDFNWNVIWDESPKSPLRGNFAETVELLNDLGLRSVYHHHTDAEFGDEEDPTFVMHKKREKSYHIDYIFAPEGAVTGMRNYSIGTYDDWIDASDHVPTVVEFED